MKVHKTNSSAWWPLLVGLLAVLTFGIVIAQVANNGSSARSDSSSQVVQSPLESVTGSPPAQETATPAPPPTASVTDEPTATDIPTPDEQATQNFIATFVMEGQLILATAQQRLTDQPLVNPPRPTGILEPSGNDFPSGVYIIQNSWQNIVNGEWVGVYAGASAQDPTQGLVVVAALPRDMGYLTVVKAGSLRIVAEANFRLTLISTDGTTFYFDVPGRRFVDSLTEVVPTVTPYMSETPSATWTPGPTQTPWPTCTPGPTATFTLILPPRSCSG